MMNAINFPHREISFPFVNIKSVETNVFLTSGKYPKYCSYSALCSLRLFLLTAYKLKVIIFI